jgi:hypothetical protein
VIEPARTSLVQYKSPRTVKTPTASSFTLARFSVARGAPAVEVRT